MPVREGCRSSTTLLRSAVAAMLVLLAAERELKAYVDPGSGALLWQVLVGAFIGALFYLRRLAAFFRKRKD